MTNDPDTLLKEARTRIDAIDDRIVDLLIDRYRIVREVVDIKHRSDLSVVQSARVDQVKDRVAARAAAAGLDGELLRALYTRIIDHAHVLEHRAMAEKGIK